MPSLVTVEVPTIGRSCSAARSRLQPLACRREIHLVGDDDLGLGRDLRFVGLELGADGEIGTDRVFSASVDDMTSTGARSTWRRKR